MYVGEIETRHLFNAENQVSVTDEKYTITYYLITYDAR